MIAHQTIGQNINAAGLTVAFECEFVKTPVFVVGKDIFTIIPALSNMVRIAG
jgi:hypothetical protein